MLEQESTKVPTRIIKVIDLEPGMLFKKSDKQQKFRRCEKLVDLSDISYSAHKGKTLVLHDGCRQWIVEPTQEVVIQDYPEYYAETVYPDSQTEKRRLSYQESMELEDSLKMIAELPEE